MRVTEYFYDDCSLAAICLNKFSHVARAPLTQELIDRKTVMAMQIPRTSAQCFMVNAQNEGVANADWLLVDLLPCSTVSFRISFKDHATSAHIHTQRP